MEADTMLVVAHQGGWDEVIFVVVPLAILAVLLWLARRRAEDEADADRAGTRLGSEPEAPDR
ncbi:MAG: hypothetical protein KY447_06440 [Actinobacteria bacterium]|nr:hypothetical protein [Actinomycetota bacterium]MBW3642537.1 hypothetical protein [Actinomycetota bacterium]